MQLEDSKFEKIYPAPRFIFGLSESCGLGIGRVALHISHKIDMLYSIREYGQNGRSHRSMEQGYHQNLFRPG